MARDYIWHVTRRPDCAKLQGEISLRPHRAFAASWRHFQQPPPRPCSVDVWRGKVRSSRRLRRCWLHRACALRVAVTHLRYAGSRLMGRADQRPPPAALRARALAFPMCALRVRLPAARAMPGAEAALVFGRRRGPETRGSQRQRVPRHAEAPTAAAAVAAG